MQPEQLDIGCDIILLNLLVMLVHVGGVGVRTRMKNSECVVDKGFQDMAELGH